MGHTRTSTAMRPGALPMTGHNGQDYFIDFRLQEIRPIDQPWNSTPFTAINDETLKAQIRGIRAEFWGLFYMEGLDDAPIRDMNY